MESLLSIHCLKLQGLGMMRAVKGKDVPRVDKRKSSWVNKGIYSASECFGCANKVEHEFREYGVRILCRDYCNYEPKDAQKISGSESHSSIALVERATS